MPGKLFPPEFLPQLLARVDLPELIGRYVPLKKVGHEYKACCPFHNEKTPSFTVSPQKGFYHCFGCGAHGNAIGFLMDYDKRTFVEAVEELARQVGMEVPRSNQGTWKSYDALYACMEEASRYYATQLARSEVAKNYARERGLTGEICKEYRIGFAPPGFENIEPGLAKKFSREQLLQVGLLTQKDGKIYDKFRKRLMFPIRNLRGQVVAFGGRVIEAEDMPKYMNSPETPIFHKGRVLYGLHEVQRRRGKIENLVVTEGYMDVVSLAQAGVHNAVATLGTATTEDHIRQMGRFCRTYTFCFDGDRAGREAGWRALKNLLPVIREGDQVRFAFLPEGEDPDSYIRAQGPEGWQKFLSESDLLEDYFFTHLAEALDLTTAQGKAALVSEARPLLGSMRDSVFRDLMVQKLKEMTGLNVRQLRLKTEEQAARKYHLQRPAVSRDRSPLRIMLRMLLEYPDLYQSAPSPKEIAALDAPGCQVLARIVELIAQHPETNAGGIIASFHGEKEQEHLSRLLRWKPIELDQTTRAEEVRGSFVQCWHKFEGEHVQRLIKSMEGQVLDPSETQKLEHLKHRRIELRHQSKKVKSSNPQRAQG